MSERTRLLHWTILIDCAGACAFCDRDLGHFVIAGVGIGGPGSFRALRQQESASTFKVRYPFGILQGEAHLRSRMRASLEEL